MKHRLLVALRDLVPTVRSTLVSVLAVAVVIGTLLAVRSATTSVNTELRQERQRVAVALAAAIGATRDAMVTSVASGFQQVEPWSAAKGNSPELLRSLTSPGLGILIGEVINESGVVVLSLPSAPDTKGFIRSGEHIAQARATGEVVISGIERDPVLNQDVIRIAVPIATVPREGPTVGVAVIPVKDGVLRAALARFADVRTPLTRIGVALPGGAVITSDGIGHAGDQTWSEPLSAAQRGEAMVDYRGLAGVERLGATADAGQGWTAIISQPIAEVEPTLAEHRPAAAAIPGMLALLFLLAALGVARRRKERVLTSNADDAKRAFLAVTGHELRTPLTVMGGMLKTMDGALARGKVKPEMLATMVDAARRNAQLLELRVERILLVAALEADAGATVQAREVRLHDVIVDLVNTMSQTAPTHDFTYDIPEDLVATADPKALGQIMLELLNNSVRYTPGDGTIHVQARKKIRYAEITVTDNGVGLPLDDAHLFERFRQGEEVDKRVHDEGGVGLGLFIVRTLATAMKGHIRAERLEQGTRLVLELPLS